MSSANFKLKSLEHSFQNFSKMLKIVAYFKLNKFHEKLVKKVLSHIYKKFSKKHTNLIVTQLSRLTDRYVDLY